MAEITLDELIGIFEEVIDLGDVSVGSDSVLGRDIAVDSKEMLMILSRIESRYHFRFDPRQVIYIETFGDILKIISFDGKSL